MDCRFIYRNLVLLAVLCGSTQASANVQITRCMGASGETMYTDGSCRAVGAEPVPMSAELLRNLVREGAIGTAPEHGLARTGASTSPPSRSAGGRSCATTPAQLASDLRTSLQGGDVNGLAAVYDWAGLSGRQARPILRKLERMSDQPLIDGRYFDSGSHGAGVVQLVQGAATAPSVTELAVMRRAGCLFLHF